MATIREVAKTAGLSVGTVSNVLNGIDTVSEANRKKVLDAVNELGFKPSRVAASLTKKITRNIGIIVPDIASPFYADLIKGITESLEKEGYNAFLCGSNDNIEKETKLINDLMSLWVDGMIIVPVYQREKNTDIINSIDIPVVIINREIKGLNKDIVVFNNFKGAYRATSYLIEKNHKKIVILSGPEYSRSFEDRLLGWQEAMEEHGIFEPSLIFRGYYSEDSGYQAMQNALLEIKNIDAVFASSDIIALGAIRAITEKGLKIPEDISIVGFGDIYLAKYLQPPLTTVKRPFYNIGETAVSLIMGGIAGKKDAGSVKEPARIVLEDSLEIRKSVRPKNF